MCPRSGLLPLLTVFLSGNLVEAVKVLDGIESNVSGLAMVALRRISLERRQGNFQQTENLYSAAIAGAKKQDVKSFYTIKYARYLSKVRFCLCIYSMV